MNKVMLIGRLTKDPEVRYSQDDNNTIARYSLAVDGYNDHTDFINVTAFGKTAEFAEKYLAKGRKIAIEGRLHTDNYKNNEDKTVYTWSVIAEKHFFCDSKNNEQNNEQNNTQESKDFVSVQSEVDDELPFM